MGRKKKAEFYSHYNLDTEQSNRFFESLCNQVETRVVADILEITPQHLWRLRRKYSAPSKRIIARIAHWRKISIEETKKLIFGDGKIVVPTPPHPNIRRAVLDNALFDDQKKEVIVSPSTVEIELELVTYYHLVSKGMRFLETQMRYEVLSDEDQQEAIALHDNDLKLSQKFGGCLGKWWKRKEGYFFTNGYSQSPPITFVKTLAEYNAKKDHLKKIQTSLSESFPGVF